MFEVESLSYIKKIYPFEWLIVIIYALGIMIYGFLVQSLKQRTQPVYRFYSWALLAKIFSSIIFCCIYIYYYQGGDTIAYFETSRALVNLGFKDPGAFMQVMTHAPSTANYYLFDQQTGFPWPYMYYDSNTFFVAKLLAPILAISFRSYLLSSIILSFLSFFGTWQLFLMMNKLYPGIERRLALGVLFVPSVLFWGSGILKDTITFSGVCWFIFGFYSAFIGKQKRRRGIIVLIIATYVLVSVKPYVLIALLPGAFVWFFHNRIIRITSKFIRVIIIPFILVLSIVVGYAFLALLGDRLGKFSVERMFKTAAITQYDLRQDYYHGSSFDIGSFDPTLAGVLSKAPAAMNVGLFRPFIWESRNVVMIISGLENLIYLLLAVIILWRMLWDPRRFFSILFNQPMLLFLLSYSLMFSALIGLSTSNFGALVRFKIPFLSSFVLLLLVMEFLMDRKNSVYLSRLDKRSLDRFTKSQPA